MDRGREAWRERAIRDAVLGGDTAAWRAWYDEHYCRLAGYVNWRCGGIADLAEDVLQETWLVAIKRLKAFDPGQAPFAAWLNGIAANAVRNALRARRRNRVQPLQARTEPAAPCKAEVCEKAERVAEALAALNPLYEVVLRAKYLEKQTVDEMAAALGESSKAIESRLTRARQAFREVYEASHD